MNIFGAFAGTSQVKMEGEDYEQRTQQGLMQQAALLPKENRKLRLSASEDLFVMDLIRQEQLSGLDVMDAAVVQDTQHPPKNRLRDVRPPSENRSLQRRDIGATFLQSVGAAESAAASRIEDNFVLEWAYSYDADEWKVLEDKLDAKDGEQKDGQQDAEQKIDQPAVAQQIQAEDGSKRKRRLPSAKVKAEKQDDEDDFGDTKRRKKSWRKYGEKILKGSQFLGMEMTRCYFRCNVKGPPAHVPCLTPCWPSRCMLYAQVAA